MDLFEALETTRSVRRFTDAPVTDDEIMTCIRAATQAPSGGNIQPWQFLVVRDAGTKRAIGDVYRRAYDRYEPALLRVRPPARSAEEEASFQRMVRASRHLAEHLGEAPALVLVLMPNISMTLADDRGPLDVGTAFASVYPAVQNLMLAARGLGIGTTLTTVYRIYQDEVRAACGIPDRYEIVALVPMGRPRRPFRVGRRRPLEQVTHWERFGSKATPAR
ncbi:MAG TPA: nitroreductase family protein [Solirubrobacteraceae bacterium]